MSRNRFAQLAEAAGLGPICKACDDPNIGYSTEVWDEELRRFSALIVKECIDNLEFHGHDEAASQLEWLQVNRFGVKQ